MRQIMRLAPGVFVLLAVAFFPMGTIGAENFVKANPIPADVPLHEHPTLQQMWRQNNAWRAAVNLPPQKMNPQLCAAAQDQAWFMAKDMKMDHYTNGGPFSRCDKAGYKYKSVRENIAWNQRGVAQVFEAWKDSPGHWANMASNETEVGCGYAISEKGEPYWVVVYGTPKEEE